MYKECTSTFYIYTKNVQTVQNLYKVQTERACNLKCMFFSTCKQYANYTKPIQLAN